MSKAKIAITLEEKTLHSLDQLVKEKVYSNRSRAIEDAVEEKLDRLLKLRLEKESSKLDPDYEKRFADEGITLELDDWPEY